MQIDLNADLGESFGAYSIGNDAEIMKYISSANIACGFHAGDPLVMAKTIQLAILNNVAIGAHPGYPDIQGFGRRSMNLSEEELFASVLYQVGALKSMVEAYGARLKHVKPHGALYNDVAKDYKKASCVAEAIYQIDPNLIFVGLANSEMLQAARDKGLRVASEVFADRAYTDEGFLVPRNQANSVFQETETCLDQVNQMLTEGSVQSISGKRIPIQADTVCVHGDSIHALDLVKALTNFCHQKGIEIKSL